MNKNATNRGSQNGDQNLLPNHNAVITYQGMEIWLKSLFLKMQVFQ